MTTQEFVNQIDAIDSQLCELAIAHVRRNLPTEEFDRQRDHLLSRKSRLESNRALEALQSRGNYVTAN